MDRCIFLYGTLQKTLARGQAAQLVSRLGEGQAAETRGRLYLIRDRRGAYPALVPGKGRVKGTLYELPRQPGWLAALDRYELYHPFGSRPSDYLRRMVRVRLAGGTDRRAFCYFYNRPPRRTDELLPHGDFARRLSAGGIVAYG